MAVEQPIYDDESRERLRVTCKAKVLVETKDRRVVRGELRDVGLNSLYLFTDADNDEFLIHGENVKVSVIMRRDGSKLTIEQEGRVSRMDETGFVVQFSNSLRWWPIFIMFPTIKDS